MRLFALLAFAAQRLRSASRLTCRTPFAARSPVIAPASSRHPLSRAPARPRALAHVARVRRGATFVTFGPGARSRFSRALSSTRARKSANFANIEPHQRKRPASRRAFCLAVKGQALAVRRSPPACQSRHGPRAGARSASHNARQVRDARRGRPGSRRWRRAAALRSFGASNNRSPRQVLLRKVAGALGVSQAGPC